MAGLLIVGAGGHGKVVADLAARLGAWDRIAFLDQKFPALSHVLGWKVVGRIEEAGDFRGEYTDLVVAFGDNVHRLAALRRFQALGFATPALVHPDASVSTLATLGPGTVVCALAAVVIGARLGMAGIINTGASVDHDCVLGDGVHVAPGVRLAGGVTVADCSWIGMGAVVRENLSIGANVMIGAGAVVVKPVPDDVQVLGIPGRVVKRLPPLAPEWLASLSER